MATQLYLLALAYYGKCRTQIWVNSTCIQQWSDFVDDICVDSPFYNLYLTDI